MSLLKIDNTILKDYRQCPRKGYLRHQRELVMSSEGRSPALEFGRCIHLGLDAMYQDKDLGPAIHAFIDSYQPFWDEFLLSDLNTRETRTPELGKTVLSGYWINWANEIENLEVVSIEEYFEFELTENVIYCGVIDKVFRDRHTGMLVGMDHKTTSRLTSAYIASLRIFQQFRGYIYYLKRHSQWQAEMSDYFYADFLLTSKTFQGGSPFYRDTVLCDDAMLDEWLDGTLSQLDIIHRIDDTCATISDVPQNTDACADYNRLCGFYDICQAPPALRESTIATAYVTNAWDPSDR